MELPYEELIHALKLEIKLLKEDAKLLKEKNKSLKSQVKELEKERTLWMNGEIKANRRVALLEHMIGVMLYAANQAGVKPPKG